MMQNTALIDSVYKPLFLIRILSSVEMSQKSDRIYWQASLFLFYLETGQNNKIKQPFKILSSHLSTAQKAGKNSLT